MSEKTLYLVSQNWMRRGRSVSITRVVGRETGKSFMVSEYKDLTGASPIYNRSRLPKITPGGKSVLYDNFRVFGFLTYGDAANRAAYLCRAAASAMAREVGILKSRAKEYEEAAAEFFENGSERYFA